MSNYLGKLASLEILDVSAMDFQEDLLMGNTVFGKLYSLSRLNINESQRELFRAEFSLSSVETTIHIIKKGLKRKVQDGLTNSVKNP